VREAQYFHGAVSLRGTVPQGCVDGLVRARDVVKQLVVREARLLAELAVALYALMANLKPVQRGKVDRLGTVVLPYGAARTKAAQLG